MDIVAKQLTKRFGDVIVFNGLNCTFRAGGITGLMGPSGCGKTTLLRILMGFERLDDGTILGLAGKRLSAVFQEDRLCENLSPVSNVRLVSKQPRQTVVDMLKQAGLADSLDRPARELSGGMRRRVAVVRALLADYDLLLLDEPFKGLDVQTAQQVMDLVAEQTQGKTVVLVTHDPTEAARLGATVLKL